MSWSQQKILGKITQGHHRTSHLKEKPLWQLVLLLKAYLIKKIEKYINFPTYCEKREGSSFRWNSEYFFHFLLLKKKVMQLNSSWQFILNSGSAGGTLQDYLNFEGP